MSFCLCIKYFPVEEEEGTIRFCSFFITSIVATDSIFEICTHTDVNVLPGATQECVGKMHKIRRVVPGAGIESIWLAAKLYIDVI